MEKHLKMATFLAKMLDTRFALGKLRFGLSAPINLIPGIGDLLDALLSLYLVWIATQLHVPPIRVAQMLFNIGFSFFMGLFPVIGDVGYILYKANIRNLAILKKYSPIVEGQVA